MTVRISLHIGASRLNASDFCLLRLPEDPRRGGPFPLADTDLNQYVPVLATTLPIQPGHYIMARVEKAHDQTCKSSRNIELERG